MSSQLYILTALTNLHVGSGDSHYGIIDNLVQRDVLTKYPTIHASSLKGALRQAYINNPTVKQDNLRTLFGDQPRGDNKPGLQGSYAFSSPQLLSFPVRSDKIPYLNVTSPGLLYHLLENQKQFGFKLDKRADLEAFYKTIAAVEKPSVFNLNLKDAILERHTLKATLINSSSASVLRPLLGDQIAVVPDMLVAKLCGENRLPVIARNNLENGISRNLWYEEVVPRQTRFWFWVQPKNDADKLHSDFTELIKNPIQIGANASIGYGFCSIALQS